MMMTVSKHVWKYFFYHQRMKLTIFAWNMICLSSPYHIRKMMFSLILQGGSNLKKEDAGNILLNEL